MLFLFLFRKATESFLNNQRIVQFFVYFFFLFVKCGQNRAIFCTNTPLVCNIGAVFLKKICVSERKCVTLHPISAKSRKNFKIAKSLLTF